MASLDKNLTENHLQSQEIHEKPQSFWDALKHVAWIAGLFLVFKGISLYTEDRREESADSTPVVSAPAEPVITLGLPNKTSQSALAAGETLPTAPAIATPQSEATPTMVAPVTGSKSVSKATTCSELQDVFDYWTGIAKKPRTEARADWIKERIQDVQVQKAALNCK